MDMAILLRLFGKKWNWKRNSMGKKYKEVEEGGGYGEGEEVGTFFFFVGGACQCPGLGGGCEV